jgi:type II secretory pathway pseudopilin PulG
MHARCPRPTAERRDAGFGVVELVVALLVGAILLALLVIAFRGTKSATYAKEAAAVGSAYSQSVSQYQADFARRNPPGMAGNNGATQKRGPLNVLKSPYLHAVPDGVTAGRIGVSWVEGTTGACANGGKPTPPGASAGAKQVGWVTVCLGTAPQYAVRVSARANASASWSAKDATSCWVGASGMVRTPSC